MWNIHQKIQDATKVSSQAAKTNINENKKRTILYKFALHKKF